MLFATKNLTVNNLRLINSLIQQRIQKQDWGWGQGRTTEHIGTSKIPSCRQSSGEVRIKKKYSATHSEYQAITGQGK